MNWQCDRIDDDCVDSLYVNTIDFLFKYMKTVLDLLVHQYSTEGTPLTQSHVHTHTIQDYDQIQNHSRLGSSDECRTTLSFHDCDRCRP